MKNQNIKRKWIFFKTTGLFFVILLLLIQTSSFAQKSFTVSITDNYPEIVLVTDEKGNSFEKVILKDLEQTHKVGKPNLPVKYINILAPTGFEFDNIVIEYTEEEEILLTQDIYLTPQSDKNSSHSLLQQEENYDFEAPWPEQKVKLIHQGYFDGSNRIITLAVFPTIYFQKQNKLTKVSLFLKHYISIN